ncbi:MAG: laccase domain-containing protein [Chthoniobacteraceae bacterium]
MEHVETFPALAEIAAIRHGFIGRVPGLHLIEGRDLLGEEFHAAAARANSGLADRTFITAEQVHGSEVTVVHARSTVPVVGADGLITNDPRVCLGIRVADCGPVYLVDPALRVIALLHSGRKGTELDITAVAIAEMQRVFGCDPANLIVQLGPCIRPPLYEIDFAAAILAQARAAGVRAVHDCGTCTGANVGRYYSYRIERGKTGRLLAFLSLA